MLLVVRHLTHMRYLEGAAGLALRLRLFPQSFEGQRVTDWHVEVDGEEIAPSIVGGYGERFAQWLSPGHRDQLEIVAHGCIETEDKAGIVQGLRHACPPAIFLRDTPLTAADGAITALGDGLSQGADVLAGLHALSARVRDALPYRGGITDSGTSAAAALAGGGGVCQDHAHIFIAAARARGVPARYVAGYLLAGDETDQQFETHAWTEAFVENLGWIGFDVTNGICPTERYVRLCTGLDARDAAPVRGIVTGGGPGTVSADVRIARGEGDIAAIQQQQQQ
ncbi:transglutaminase family protein [Sphingomonas cannabina]|uniref:transglutaminase family protein n=1 Tax=Sphingomonas cannabina TaxID=2899123 RepID=UPI001F345099|nr:transglutaminase family protein [Sphingomonas cannabina]UIJ47112.1 transglutaminase family protein [Sphingomonas cannabina]